MFRRHIAAMVDTKTTGDAHKARVLAGAIVVERRRLPSGACERVARGPMARPMGTAFEGASVKAKLGEHALGNGDMRRILMYEEFVGYPLRKDYPVRAKQPRIPLRIPELRNTSADMHRQQLVSLPVGGSRSGNQKPDQQKTHNQKIVPTE